MQRFITAAGVRYLVPEIYYKYVILIYMKHMLLHEDME